MSFFRSQKAVFAAVPLATFALGTWQVRRLQWKTDLLQKIEDRRSEDPIAVASTDAALDHLLARSTATQSSEVVDRVVNESDDGLEFRRLRFRGVFDHGREIFVGPRTNDGNAGFHVVTPLVLENGRSIMVNRGWIPHDMKDPKLRSAGNPTGPVDVIGMLRHPIRPSSFTPDNVPEKGQWHWIDVGQLADTLRADPIVIDVTDANFPGGLPMADQTTANIRNNHLSYAVTWYMLSASTAAMIFLL